LDEDDAQRVASDAEVVKAQVLKEFVLFMQLSRARRLLAKQDVDSLLTDFSSFLTWIHAPAEAVTQ
jgi:hypothetical protein